MVRKLRAVREDAKLTQAQLAELVGTDRTTITKIEHGNRNPSWDLCLKLADTLGKPIGYLLKQETRADPNES
jgi:putative transcriptional regulator